MVRWSSFGSRWRAAALLALVSAAGLTLWMGQSAAASATCSIYWTGRASTDWSATANWSASDGGSSAARLPSDSDFVCMSSVPSRATVVLNSGRSASVAGVNWPATATVTPSLQVSGSLGIGTNSGSFDSNVAALQVTSGTLSLMPGLVVTTLVQSGTIQGRGSLSLPASATWTLAAGSALEEGVVVNNLGTATVPQGSQVAIGHASELHNGGTLRFSDGSALNNAYYGAAGAFVNEAGGQVTYSGSSAGSSAGIAVGFDNYGTVTVNKGTLDVSYGGTDATTGDTGTYSAGVVGVVRFGGYRRLANGVSFPGSGQIAAYGTVALGLGIAVTMRNVLLDGGTFTGRGTLTVPAGGAAVLGNGALAGGLHVINHGTSSIKAIATVAFYDGSSLENAGTFNLADNSSLGGPYCCGAANGYMVNDAAATIVYKGSASSSAASVVVPFDNYGAVDIQRGTATLSGASTSESTFDSGSYTVASIGGIAFAGQRWFSSSATFPGPGLVTINSTMHLPKGVALSMVNVQVTGGTLAGKGSLTIPSGGVATLTGATLSGGVQLINRGALTVDTNSSVSIADNSTIDNRAELDLADGNDVGTPNCCDLANGALVNESGATVDYSGSATNSQTTMFVPFDNYGKVTVERGTLNITGGSSARSSGDTGAYDVSPTSFVAYGGVRVFTAAATFPGAGQVTNAGGRLYFRGNVAIPNLVWQGGSIEIAPGAVVTATLGADPSGTLQVDGDRPAHYGRFVVGGSVSLAAMYVALSNSSFTPPCGQAISALQAAAVNGQFASVYDDNPPPGASMVATYSATVATVLVRCPPPPTASYRTYGTGHGFDARNPSGYYAEPVNTATGAYATQQTDAALHALGVPFVFTRYYTSANATSGRLGPGWTDSLSAALNPQGTTVYLTSENGQQETFTQQPDGSYTGDAGVYSRLTQTSTGWTVTRKDRTHLDFDASGRLLSIKEGNGMGLTLTYDGAGELASVKDSGGRTATFTYTGGLLTSIALPLSRTVAYTYDAAGHLASVTSPLGHKTSYSYDSSGRLVSIADANGHVVVQNTYDDSGRVVAQRDALNHQSSFAYDAGGQATTFTDARGHKWVDQYSDNVLTSRTDPLGHVTTYAYDGDLNVSAVTTPNGNTTLMDYDADGNMVDRTSPAPYGYEEVWTYNGLDEPVSFRDRRGSTTRYTYDGRGNLLKVTAADGTSTSNSYDATTGALVATTSASGKTTRYGYDSARNMVRITSPLGEITTYTYDGAGRRASEVLPLGNVSGATPAQHTTRYTYDSDDRPTTVTDPLGGKTTTTYDKVDDRTSLTNPNGHKTSYSYDAANHLTKITVPDATTTTLTYDAVGDLLTRLDANGHTTTYTYDADNRRVSAKTPLGNLTTFAYDRDDNVVKTVVAGAGGGSTTYSFDALDRPTSVAYSDGTPTVRYGYDADSNRTSLTDGVGTASYVYNSRNLLTKLTRGTSILSYAYTPDGEVSGRTYPNGATVLAYDADQRLASVTAGGATSTYGYDAGGNLTATALPSSTGVVETRSYDNADRLADVSSAAGSTVLADTAIIRDAAGNPTAVNGPNGPIAYSYDSRERLTQACYGAACATANLSWTYDGVGNRLTSLAGAVTTTNTYDADDELVKSVTGPATVTRTYDAAGRLLGDGTNSYTWNVANQLTSVGGPNAAAYTYDGDSNRISIRIAGAATSLVWDPNGDLPQIATITAPGGAQQSYIWGQGSVGFTTTVGNFYNLHDDQGSTIGVIASDGTLQSTASYDPFGVPLVTTSPVAGAPSNPIGWQGQLADATGQYNLRAREYDPTTGRFLSRDPLESDREEALGSAYLYANNMPTTMTDPSGSCALGIFGHRCGPIGQAVLVGLNVTAAVVSGACAVVSLGSLVPCDVAAAWGVAEAGNDLYNYLTPGESNHSVSGSGSSNNSYYAGDSYNYYSTGGRGPNK